jgi:hypothetical protein
MRIQKCTCPKGITGMDKLCPPCLAEYEENLMADYTSIEDGEFLKIETEEREFDYLTALYEAILEDHHNNKKGA